MTIHQTDRLARNPIGSVERIGRHLNSMIGSRPRTYPCYDADTKRNNSN
ncbi:MAG: hypothetical protein PVH26_02270 [Desulfosarcina sp.]